MKKKKKKQAGAMKTAITWSDVEKDSCLNKLETFQKKIKENQSRQGSHTWKWTHERSNYTESNENCEWNDITYFLWIYLLNMNLFLSNQIIAILKANFV